MPLWAILVFIAGFLFSIIYISWPVKQVAINAGISSKAAANIRLGIISFYLLYLLYASLLALYGVLDVNALPPRAILYAGVPLALILFGLIGNTQIFKKLLTAISLQSLISLHIFRILGVFFLILYGFHLLPAAFALFAGMGDMITAIAAIPVARMVARQTKGWRAAVIVWNVFGILDIVDLLIAAAVTAKNGNLREVAIFPFVWFPAFAPATILFLHVTVFRKLKQLNNSANAIQGI